MTKERLHPEVVMKVYSPNYSERTTSISVIVLHSTESDNIPHSKADLSGVAGWFKNPASQVSAHVVVDSDSHSARCVSDSHKAWHCVSYNNPSLGIEQVGHAAQSEWSRHEYMETARWIAQWSHEYHVPIRRAIVYRGMVIRQGVTTHRKLGIWGGGHDDPGDHYPLRTVLKEARRIKKKRYNK